MSEAAGKVRWPWVAVAVIGLCGALLLPLRSLSMKDAQQPASGLTQVAPEKRLLLKPATPPPQDVGNPSNGTGYGHGTGSGTGKQPHKPADKPERPAEFAAGPLGPPDPNQPSSNNAGDVPERGTQPISPEQIKQQLPGRFALSAPTKMEVGRSEHVTVVAAIEQLRTLVTTELQAVTGDQNPQTVSTKDLPLSRLLRVELRADSDADFEIRSFTQADQRLSDQQATTWEWSVTPKSNGDKHLTVVISNLVDGQGQPIAVTIAHRSVHVTLTIAQQIREISGTASSAASALAGLVGTWLGLLKPLLQRRREEEGKSGSKVEPDSQPLGKPDADKTDPKPDATHEPAKAEPTAASAQSNPGTATSDPHPPK